MKWIAIFALAALCGGCATVTRGSTEQIQILSEPPGADARTSMGYMCVTPCTLQVGRKDEFTVTISKPGFETAQVPVNTKVSGKGGAAVAGNVIIGGLIGLGVDASTGAGLDHDPNPVSVDLVPVKPVPRAVRPQPPKSFPRAKNVPEG